MRTRLTIDAPVPHESLGRHRAFVRRSWHTARLPARRVAGYAAPIERVLQRASQSRWYQIVLAVSHATRVTQLLVTNYLCATTRNSIALRGEHARLFVERLVLREQSFAARMLQVRLGASAAARAVAGSQERLTPTSEISRVARTPMVIARPQANAAPPRAADPDAVLTSDRQMAPSASRASNTRPEPFALPAQELSRVTDHVIQQLDRRVLSHRERMGQV